MFAPNTKILIVDDMLTMRKLVKKCLIDMGFNNISEAPDGADAWPELEKASEIGAPYHLVISDWNMPKMKGVELLRKVRGHAGMSETPFVLLTAEAEKAIVVEAIQAGASSYITKPFAPAALAEKLKAVHEAVSKK